MTASYIVRYHGSAAEPDRFVDYYRNSHAPILQRFPGIGSLVLHHGADFTDPFQVTPGGNLLIAYDNTQRDVNHVHTVWRDLSMDFGGDPLAQHYVDHH